MDCFFELIQSGHKSGLVDSETDSQMAFAADSEGGARRETDAIRFDQFLAEFKRVCEPSIFGKQ